MSEKAPSYAAQVTGTLSLAHLALTSMITTSAGALVAVLSFAAQAKPLTVNALHALGWSLGFVGSSLALSLSASILGYLYQFTLTYSQTEVVWLRLAAKACVGIAFCSLLAGGFKGIILVLAVSG